VARPEPGAKPSRRRRVLFVSPGRWVPFIDGDLELLRRDHDVDVIYRADYTSRRELLPAVLRLFVERRFDLIYVWFSEPYDTPPILLLSRLFGARSVLVVGGYEVTHIRALDYGALTGRGKRIQQRVALQLAHLVLPTSTLLEREVRALGRKRRVRVVPPQIDCDFFTPDEEQREPLVVTVARITERQWRVKGLDVFARVSRELPEARFVILGPCDEPRLAERIRELGGDNLEIPGPKLDASELLAWYRRAHVYAQLSVRETFGVALAEAMASGCRPVASDLPPLRDLIGDRGFLVPPGDVERAGAAIRRALTEPVSRNVRDHVCSRFAAPARELQLAREISTLMA
jgi:glycosyltransferase involved in cell wall biosynthesis